MSSSAVNYNLQNLFGQSGPQNLFGTGSNQYGGGWPNMNYASPNSYSVPSSGPYHAQTPGLQSGPGGYYTGSSYDPQLTSSLFGYLGSQVGQGLPQYPGQLTAPPNELYGQLGNLLTGGQSNIPYGQQMLQMAQTGNPTDVGPAWEAMIKASQQNIAENQAQLKEQYAAGGNLVGTPYGSAMSDYMSQTALGENAILTQAQQQAAEAAAGREAGMQQYLTGTDMALGGQLQGIQQLGATNAYNEWLRTQPQYNPLLSQAYGAATTFPPYLNPQQSPWAMLIPALLNAYKFPSGGGSKTGGGSSDPSQTPQGTPPIFSEGHYPPGTQQTPNYSVNYPWNFPMPGIGAGVGTQVDTGMITDPSQMQYPPDTSGGNYPVNYPPLQNMPGLPAGVGTQTNTNIITDPSQMQTDPGYIGNYDTSNQSNPYFNNYAYGGDTSANYYQYDPTGGGIVNYML